MRQGVIDGTACGGRYDAVLSVKSTPSQSSPVSWAISAWYPTWTRRVGDPEGFRMGSVRVVALKS